MRSDHRLGHHAKPDTAVIRVEPAFPVMRRFDRLDQNPASARLIPVDNVKVAIDGTAACIRSISSS